MRCRRQHLFIIMIAVLMPALSGCVQFEKTGPVNPDVSLFELYVSDLDKVRLDDPVFTRGDTVFFTLKYQEAENFKPLEVSNIQYEFSKLKPVNMDVHKGFPIDDLTFLDSNSSPISAVTLSPGESVLLSLTIPETQEKWDEILTQSSSNQSVEFNLVIKIKDLVVPLRSNELTVRV